MAWCGLCVARRCLEDDLIANAVAANALAANAAGVASFAHVAIKGGLLIQNCAHIIHRFGQEINMLLEEKALLDAG